LDELFWNSPQTLRYGASENLYGYEAIAAVSRRRARAGAWARGAEDGDHDVRARLRDREHRVPPRQQRRTGRQSQTWVRMPEGWRIVAAHVSLLASPA
jgi:hypothetical protein